MENNVPKTPQNQNHPDFNYSHEGQTRRTLYLIGFALLVGQCVLVVCLAIWVLTLYLRFNRIIREADDEIITAFSYLYSIIYLILSVVLWFSLTWTVSMTVLSYRYYQQVETNQEQSHIAFGVCSIIFLGLLGIVAGILFIVASNSFTNDQNKKMGAFYRPQ